MLTEARIVYRDERKIELEWDGTAGGIGSVAVAGGAEYKLVGIGRRGFQNGKFVSSGWVWTPEFVAEQATKKAEERRVGRLAADTDRY